MEQRANEGGRPVLAETVVFFIIFIAAVCLISGRGPFFGRMKLISVTGRDWLRPAGRKNGRIGKGMLGRGIGKE